MMDNPNIAARLARRVLNAIGRGRVTTSNDSGVVQLIQAKFNDLETIDGMPRIAEFGFTSRPPTGSDVLAVFIGGDRSSGVIAGTNHQASRPKGLAEGESKLYSVDGKYVYITASGGISIFANGQPVTVSGATVVTINASSEVVMNTPLLSVSGDIIDNAASNPHTMAQMRSIYNAHTHPVKGVQTGSSQVTSDAPSQAE